MDLNWNAVADRLPIGTQVKDGAYTVTSHDSKGFVMTRNASGKTVRITKSKTVKVFARLATGERLPKQSNAGISYTVAIEAGIVAALGNAIALDGREWVATSFISLAA
tara:strand:+ start:321 stop:644 length:324 start_codon:yes stop_codon:yes gene_type:complete